jgi:hypothetical protein
MSAHDHFILSKKHDHFNAWVVHIQSSLVLQGLQIFGCFRSSFSKMIQTPFCKPSLVKFL